MDKQLILEQIRLLLESENDLIANLSNLSAVLNDYLKEINWVGFYLIKDHELVLGPFQGKVACTRIPLTKGVCGAAVLTKEIQLVDDVHTFEGHIACDSQSNSELVVPIIVNEEVFGVLDIDSPIFSRFNQDDALLMQQVCQLISKHIKENIDR